MTEDELQQRIADLEAEVERYKTARTLGGPPRPATRGWYRGNSVRPVQAGWDGETEEP